MKTTQVEIEQAKIDILGLIDRVASGKERIVLTSNDDPKAAIVSIEDFEFIEEKKRELRRQERFAWLAKIEELNEKIRQRRLAQGLPEEIDIDEAIRASREDLDRRHDFLLSE